MVGDLQWINVAGFRDKSRAIVKKTMSLWVS
jgi:hypothetical protein